MTRREWRSLLLLALPCGVLLLSSCTFDPRTPEPPASGEPIIYLVASEAENVIENLTSHASGLTFALDGRQLSITLSISTPDKDGNPVVHTVRGEAYVRE